MTNGLTFSIQRFSTDDGPGLRTTVFMKGCPLRCAWCHTPEGIAPHPELVWHDVRCIGARGCLSVCDESALELSSGGMRIDRGSCTVCARCAEACPSGALEIIGRAWSADDLMTELLKDRVFFETSGGGITFSGGEPIQQFEFLCQVLPRCKSAGLQVALDTCGLAAWERYERVLPYVDLVLFDLKLMDSDQHRSATGASNVLILDNARRMAERGTRLWVRTPVIPGYTDSEENITSIACFIREHLPAVERWDLLAYTNLGQPKYHRLDLSYALEDARLYTRTEMEAIWQTAAGLVPLAKWSGATRE